MFDLFKKHRLLLAVVITIIGVLIYLFEAGNYRNNSKIQNLTQTITYPVQVLVHEFISFTSDLTDSYFYLVQLHQENEALKQQVVALKEEINRYIEESVRYHRLKVQLEFAEENPLEKVFSEVIGESIDNFHQTLQINRGSRDGIQRNFAVVLKEGVVGRIQTVSPFQSTVQLILDRRSRFPAILQRTRVKGLVYGTGDDLELRRIHLRADVKVGDRVVTNGLSGLFPKGILVGTVTQVNQEDHAMFQTAELTPIVDFDKIEGVFIVIKDDIHANEKLLSGK